MAVCVVLLLPASFKGIMKMKVSKEPHYQINVNELMKPEKMDSWELGMKNSRAIQAIFAVFLAGGICLTQEGYMKLSDSLKSLFIAKEK